MLALRRLSASSSSVAGVVDLRTDQVTKPSPAMRAAMVAAEVGNDIYGEDPTVQSNYE